MGQRLTSLHTSLRHELTVWNHLWLSGFSTQSHCWCSDARLNDHCSLLGNPTPQPRGIRHSSGADVWFAGILSPLPILKPERRIKVRRITFSLIHSALVSKDEEQTGQSNLWWSMWLIYKCPLDTIMGKAKISPLWIAGMLLATGFCVRGCLVLTNDLVRPLIGI